MCLKYLCTFKRFCPWIKPLLNTFRLNICVCWVQLNLPFTDTSSFIYFPHCRDRQSIPLCFCLHGYLNGTLIHHCFSLMGNNFSYLIGPVKKSYNARVGEPFSFQSSIGAWLVLPGVGMQVSPEVGPAWRKLAAPPGQAWLRVALLRLAHCSQGKWAAELLRLLSLSLPPGLGLTKKWNCGCLWWANSGSNEGACMGGPGRTPSKKATPSPSHATPLRLRTKFPSDLPSRVNGGQDWKQKWVEWKIYLCIIGQFSAHSPLFQTSKRYE